MEIKDIIKGNTVEFSFYRAGNIFYNVVVGGITYTFPVPVDDLGQGTVTRNMKAITLMRYIRKALEAGSFVRVNNKK